MNPHLRLRLLAYARQSAYAFILATLLILAVGCLLERLTPLLR
ncbi:hypothetical protein UFOVP783_28 [uncultured Caudovirales phage]|uniref:Uncharacterized protein n=1 Tax=uncultured Caudovirales phage TaxID=2100421 RepID=A0A6J5NZC8_9CAUD|nr:hypothetical protein UFOVP783_28 [uncultured Caudovirales phage]